MDTVTGNILKAAGVSAVLLTAVFVVGGGFYIYKSYLDMKLTTLQIDKLKREKVALV